MSFEVNSQLNTRINYTQTSAVNNSQHYNAKYSNLSPLGNDVFVKTQVSDFQDIYKKFFNLNTITQAITPEIKAICNKYGLNYKITQEKINNCDIKHFEDTYNYALLTAQKMGLSEQETQDLKLAAALHDIGKLFIPDEILNKNDKLSQIEKEIISKHSKLGYLLASSMGLNQNVTGAILNHHSNVNNSKICEIIKVSDRYSALTSKRSYKTAFSPMLSYSILKSDAQNNKLFLEILNLFKTP